MTGAGVRGIGKSGERYTFVQANRALFSSGALQWQVSIARCPRDGDLPLPKPVKGATLVAKLLVSGGFRPKRLKSGGCRLITVSERKLIPS